MKLTAGRNIAGVSGSSSSVEHLLPKQRVVGSSPVSHLPHLGYYVV